MEMNSSLGCLNTMRKKRNLRRLLLLLATLGAMLALYVDTASSEVAPGEVLDANNLGQSPDAIGNGISTFFVNGQTFTAEHNGALTSVEVRLARGGSPTGPLKVQIANIDAASGLPTIPEDVLATTTLSASEVPQQYNGIDPLPIEKITFDTPASVVAGKKYALILKYEDTQDLSNSYVIANGPYTADTYTGGERIFRQSQFDPENTLGPWRRDELAFDLIFGVYVTSPDTASPKVDSTVPKANANEVPPTANLRATFSEDMQSASVKNAFKLFKQGSTTQIAAQVSYDAVTDKATLNPTNNLKRGVTYKAVVSTVAKDVAGNRLDQDDSTTGLQQKVWYFTVDDLSTEK